MKNRYLTIIASCDSTGHTYVDFYKSNTNNKDLINACEYKYREDNESYSYYLSKGMSITIDLNDLNSYNFIKDGEECLRDYKEYNKKTKEEELKEYERIKKKYSL